MACSDTFPADTAPICECNPAFGKVGNKSVHLLSGRMSVRASLQAVTVQPRPSEASGKIQ